MQSNHGIALLTGCYTKGMVKDLKEGIADMWGTKLPKKAGGRYLVTLVTGSYGGTQVRQAEFVEYSPGVFRWLVLPECSPKLDEVIAWMKQPAPYDPKKAK